MYDGDARYQLAGGCIVFGTFTASVAWAISQPAGVAVAIFWVACIVYAFALEP